MDWLFGKCATFLLLVFIIPSMDVTTEAGIFMMPVATVTNDLNGTTSTVSIDVYTGYDENESNLVTSYTYSIRMNCDFLGEDFNFFNPQVFPYQPFTPTPVSGSLWGSNFATVTATYGSDAFTFSGTNPTPVSIPSSFPDSTRSELLLGTAVFSVDRPAIGSPNNTYNIILNIFYNDPPLTSFVDDLNNYSHGLQYGFANFVIQAQGGGEVPEPSSSVVFLVGLVTAVSRKLRFKRPYKI